MGTNKNTKHVGRGGPRRGSGRPARTVTFRVHPRIVGAAPIWRDNLVAQVAKAGLDVTPTYAGTALDLEVDHRKAVVLFAVLQAVDAQAKRVDKVAAGA